MIENHETGPPALPERICSSALAFAGVAFLSM